VVKWHFSRIIATKFSIKSWEKCLHADPANNLKVNSDFFGRRCDSHVKLSILIKTIGKETMSEYQRPEDFALAKDLMSLAPREALAFKNLKATAERSDGAIPEKYRELISIAVALTTQCAYCIDAHSKNAVKAGATREEIAETVFIAAALKAGAAVGHGLLALRLFDEASETAPA
jgi:AhpD family alkylhydroperoxidase